MALRKVRWATDWMVILLKAAAFYAAYLMSAEFGNTLTFKPSAFTTFWPPSGVYLLILLSSERRSWPYYIVAALAANLSYDLIHGRAATTAALFFLANSLEAMSGAAIVRGILKRKPSFSIPRDLLITALVCCIVAVPLGASIGAAVVCLGLGSGTFPEVWATWWSADVMGILLMSPLLASWIQPYREEGAAGARPSPKRIIEASSLFLAFGIAILAVMDMSPRPMLFREYFVLPIVIWASIRFGPRGSSTANLACAVLLVVAALRGEGSAEAASAGQGTIAANTQAFLGLFSLIGLLLSAVSEESKRNAARIAESERRYREIFENAPFGISRTSRDGRLLAINRSFAEIFGYDSVPDLKNAMEGRFVQDILYADPDERERHITEKEWRGSDWVSMDNHYKRKDGSPFRGRAIVRKISPSDGGADIEAFIEDRSALIAAEEGLKAAIKEKETLLLELEHRVKNNLNVIASLLSMAASGAKEPEAKKVLIEAQTRIMSMALIYEQLYRGQSSGFVQLLPYLRELSHALIDAYALGKESVDLKLEVAAIGLDVKRSVPLGLVVNELLTNALKYAFPIGSPGRITISLASREDRIELRVSDDGIGMPRGSGSPERRGMGLRIVSELAAQLGGEMKLEKPDRGTSVLISFPESGP